MKTRYYKYTFKGEKSADEAQRALGDAAATIVRIDTGGGRTLVYVASEGAVKSSSQSAKPAAAAGGLKAEEVSEKDVTRIA